MINQDRDAYVPGFAYYDDNILLLKANLEQILRRTSHMPSIRLLSLGVGHRVIIKGLLDGLGDRLSRYVIVEGSPEIIELFEKEVVPPSSVQLIHDYFERFDTDERFDVIEMGFILEHVEDPGLILARFQRFLAPGGRMMISVPNARSLHRLIGHEAGLLQDIHSLSAADHALGHRRYFDGTQLAELLEVNGLTVVGRAGLMLKPFSTAQLASLHFDQGIRDAMNEVGFGLPDICNGIFVEAKPCP